MVTAAASLLTGILLGLFPALLVVRRSKARWLLVGQRSGEALHGRGLDGWNLTPLPERHRSPDHQLVTRAISPTRERPPLPH